MAGRADNSEIAEFITEHDVGAFQHIIDDDGSIWSDFNVRSQPAFAFIDASGSMEVTMGRLGIEDLTAAVEQLTNQ